MAHTKVVIPPIIPWIMERRSRNISVRSSRINLESLIKRMRRNKEAEGKLSSLISTMVKANCTQSTSTRTKSKMFMNRLGPQKCLRGPRNNNFRTISIRNDTENARLANTQATSSVSMSMLKPMKIELENITTPITESRNISACSVVMCAMMSRQYRSRCRLASIFACFWAASNSASSNISLSMIFSSSSLGPMCGLLACRLGLSLTTGLIMFCRDWRDGRMEGASPSAALGSITL
mmetsp:Transcript_85320/g.246336  ORF Transcript_85320/g.246336 Transcript_85320/m.246336 type:complete len:236 (+) Transcript_85320:856-1563(+)